MIAEVQPENLAPLPAEHVLADIGGEPEALRRIVATYASGTDARLRLQWIDHRSRVVGIGMGSSFAAADDAATVLGAQGFDAHAELASTGAPRPGGEQTIAILVSASGETEETLSAANRHLGKSHTIAVTPEESPLAEMADHHLPLPFGPLRTDTALQSFQATLATLGLFVSHLSARDIDDVLVKVDDAADALESLIENRDAWLSELADLVGDGPVFVAAPAERMAGARQGALVLREVPRLIAQACEIGDWSHSDVYLSARDGYKLVMLGNTPWSAELGTWLNRRRGTLVTVGGATPPVPSALHVPTLTHLTPLLETTVLELLAYELRARQAAAGLDPFEPELIG